MNRLFNDQGGSSLSYWAQEPLFVARPDGSFDPVLATELPTEENGGVSKDGRIVTFKLREGVTWSDGKPFTAEDVKFTFDVIQDRESTAFPPSAYDPVESVEVVDDQTARVRMSKPNPYFLGLFQHILPKHKFDSTAVTTEHPQARLPLGTGPYVFEEFDEGDKIVLKRNEDYWNKEEHPVRLDGITLKITPDAQSAISSFQRGEFDTVFFVTSGDLPDLTEARDNGAPIELTVQETKSHVEWLWLNQTDNGDASRPHPALGDSAMREAIDLGIDRQAVIDQVLKGFGELNGSVFYSGLATTEIPPAPFDAERANRVLVDLSAPVSPASLGHRRPDVYRLLAPAVPKSAEGDGRTLSYYERGATALFASRSDQRFSYCLYVPSDYDEDGQATYPLAVVVHGTTRTAQRYRDEFATWAERHGCVVLAPLFPCGIEERGELDNYKHIAYRDIRFDRVLLDIVEEVSETYRLRSERFLLHGFSGGSHFAHRFFYLHPDRLLGVSIGAPGMITMIDPDMPWWLGTQDLEARFGLPLRLDEMRGVAVQMVIGGEDTATWEINDHDSPNWMEGADAAGRTRLERLAALRDNFEDAGIPVRHDVIPGVGHEGHRVLEPVRSFFAATLAHTREVV